MDCLLTNYTADYCKSCTMKQNFYVQHPLLLFICVKKSVLKYI